MQTVKETNAPSSATGSGQKSMGFLGLKALFRFLGGKSNLQPKEKFTIIEDTEAPGLFWVVNNKDYGNLYTGPYKRKQDAKGVVTRLNKRNG